MRGLRGDVLHIAAVLAVPLGVAVEFPREAMRFTASAQAPRAPASAVSIVFLDSASAARAMRSTRMLSKQEGAAAGVELLSLELPGEKAAPMMSIGSRSRTRVPAVIEGGIPPFLPSQCAGAPVRIVGGKDAEELPFPRKELLKLN